jgi:hypothetical protein
MIADFARMIERAASNSCVETLCHAVRVKGYPKSKGEFIPSSCRKKRRLTE